MNAAVDANWKTVCQREDLVVDGGVIALINQQAVALIFSKQQVYALAHRDPFSGALVLGHGLLSEQGGVLAVASPLYKQHFELSSGRCLEDDNVSVATWPARIEGADVQVFC